MISGKFVREGVRVPSIKKRGKGELRESEGSVEKDHVCMCMCVCVCACV